MIGIAEISDAFLFCYLIAFSDHTRHQVIDQRIYPGCRQRSEANHLRRRLLLQINSPTTRLGIGAFQEKRHFTAWTPAGDGLFNGVARKNGLSQAWPLRLLPAAPALAKYAMAGGASTEPPDLQARCALIQLRIGGSRRKTQAQQDRCEKRMPPISSHLLKFMIAAKHRSSFHVEAFV